MSIADLFRVQQAAEQSPNPMDPNIGKSTSLPPQLLELIKQSAATEQAQMRMQAQPPAEQPTVADTVRQKAATLNQMQAQAQNNQQDVMRQLMQARQGAPAFQAGGIVALPKRYAEGGEVGVDPDVERMRDLQGARERYQRAGADTRAIDDALSFLYANMRKGQTEKFYRGRPSAGAPTAGPAAGVEALSAATNTENTAPAPRAAQRAPQEQRFDSVSPAGAKTQGVSALKEAVSDGASQAAPQTTAAAATSGQPAAGGLEALLRAQIEAKDPSLGDRDAEIERQMALYEKFGPKGAQSDFIKAQLAKRDAEIEAEQKKRPGITEIITAMAQAARENDAQRRKGSGAAALLGASTFLQGSKKERESAVRALQAKKDEMLGKIAELDDAKRSGDFNRIAALEKELRDDAAKFKERKAVLLGQAGTQELQGRQAAERSAADSAARATEGAADRASRERIASGSNAATVKAAGMRGAGLGGGDERQQLARLVALQKQLQAEAKEPLNAFDPAKKAEIAAKARAVENAIASLAGIELPTTGTAPAAGASTSGWGQATVVK